MIKNLFVTKNQKMDIKKFLIRFLKYIMTFSGKKEINLPNNIEEQKKSGTFYTNIDNGEFSETIKINVENFQLVSNKFKVESEKNGIYKYYFDIIKDSGTISSDD